MKKELWESPLLLLKNFLKRPPLKMIKGLKEIKNNNQNQSLLSLKSLKKGTKIKQTKQKLMEPKKDKGRGG